MRRARMIRWIQSEDPPVGEHYPAPWPERRALRLPQCRSFNRSIGEAVAGLTVDAASPLMLTPAYRAIGPGSHRR